MVFAGIVSTINWHFAQRKRNSCCARLHLSHWKYISMALDAMGSIVFVVSPTAVELSVVTGVGPGCGCPIFFKAVQRGMASLHP